MENVIALTILVIAYQLCNGEENISKSHPNEKINLDIIKNSTRAKRSDYCLNEMGQRGECLPYYLCDGGVANTDGSGVIDLRMAGDDETSCSYLNVCCLPPDTRDADDPIKPVLKQREGCGWRNSEGLGFRIKGRRDNEAEFGEFPWMVAVLRMTPINTHQTVAVYVGGGSLIHPRVALTAAHILRGDASAMRVRAGEWDSSTDGELYPHQDRDVAEVAIADGFNSANLFYDAALLFLARPFQLAPNVGLACLPLTSERLDTSAECFVTGWGKNTFGKEGRYQSILKKIDLNLVEHGQCEGLLRRTRLQKYFRLHPSFICAGGAPGRDACTGDGGSPLVCPIQFHRGRYRQVGIVSWGVNCGAAGVPGVYTHVAALTPWVRREMTRRGLDTSLYKY